MITANVFGSIMSDGLNNCGIVPSLSVKEAAKGGDAPTGVIKLHNTTNSSSSSVVNIIIGSSFGGGGISSILSNKLRDMLINFVNL